VKKDKPKAPEQPTRRAFLGTVAAAAGAVVVVESDRPDPPERRLLAARVRWIGHC
jgi:hypothetical protein